jgi:hypothetical protein
VQVYSDGNPLNRAGWPDVVLKLVCKKDGKAWISLHQPDGRLSSHPESHECVIRTLMRTSKRLLV